MAKTNILLSESDIDSFVSRLKAEVDAFAARLRTTMAMAKRGLELESALAKLAGNDRRSSGNGVHAAPRNKSAPIHQPPAKASKAGKRRSNGKWVSDEKILSALSDAKGGLAVREIATVVGETNKERVRTALARLRDRKSVRLTGERAKARWHLAA